MYQVPILNRNQINWPKPRGRKGNPRWFGNKKEKKRIDKEYEKGITRNIKVIVGVDENGRPIVENV